MRTRRSWRNQDRLWRELGGAGPLNTRSEVERLSAILALADLSPRVRAQIAADLQRAKVRALRRAVRS